MNEGILYSTSEAILFYVKKESKIRKYLLSIEITISVLILEARAHDVGTVTTKYIICKV